MGLCIRSCLMSGLPLVHCFAWWITCSDKASSFVRSGDKQGQAIVCVLLEKSTDLTPAGLGTYGACRNEQGSWTSRIVTKMEALKGKMVHRGVSPSVFLTALIWADALEPELCIH